MNVLKKVSCGVILIVTIVALSVGISLYLTRDEKNTEDNSYMSMANIEDVRLVDDRFIHIPNTYCNKYYETSEDDETCESGDSFDYVWEKCELDGEKCMGVQWNSCDERNTSNIEVNGSWKLLSQGQDIGDADHPTEDCGGKEQALGHWDIFVKKDALYVDPPIRIPNTYCEYFSQGGDGTCADGIPFHRAWRKCLDAENFECMGVMWNSCEGETSDVTRNGAWKLMTAGQTIGDAENPTETCGGKEQALGHWDVFVRESAYDEAPTVTSCKADQQKLEISITTDNYPGETSWTLKKFNGDKIASGGPYSKRYSTDIKQDLCLESWKCHTFTMMDSYGDGLIKGGAFSVKVDDTEIMANHDSTPFSSMKVEIGDCGAPKLFVQSSENYEQAQNGKIAILSKEKLSYWLGDDVQVPDGENIFEKIHIKENQGLVVLAKNIRTQKEGGLMVWSNSTAAFGTWNPREFSGNNDWMEGDEIELVFDKFDEVSSRGFARDCTYEVLTGTGWNLPADSIRLGQSGLAGDWWKELEIEYEFESARSIGGVWSDSLELPYTVKYENSNGEWVVIDDDCKGTKIFYTPVSSKKWRVYWASTDLFQTGGLSTYRGGGGLHAELLLGENN